VGIGAPSDGSIEYVGSQGGCTSPIGAAIMSAKRPFASSHVMEILMTIDEFLQAIKKTAPPAPTHKLAQLEVALGVLLPDWYKGPTPAGDPADAGVHHIGGFREESYFSLERARECYAGRIPNELLWIMDDPFGNAICLGVRGTHRGNIYFWDHEMEPDPDSWDGQVDTAGNVSLIAGSFAEFVAGLKPTTDE
jgi:hypothetical protein